VRLLDEEYVMEEVAFGFKPSGMASNYVSVSTHLWRRGRRTYHIVIHIGMDGPV